MSPDPIPPDLTFITLPRPLAQFHHLPEHVPLRLAEGETPPGGYNFTQGVQAMDRLLEAAPNVPGSYLYRLYLRKWPLWQEAAPLLESGRVAEAIPILVRALDLDPDCPLTCFQLGFCFRATGEFEKSEDFYQKAMTLAPDAGWIYSNLGRTYEAASKPTEAKEAYWTALEKLPGDTFVLGRLEALGELVRLGEDPANPGTLRYVKRADFEKKMAAEIKRRNDPGEILLLGFNLLSDRLWDRAEDAFERVRELDPDSNRALLGLGVAHLHRDHPAEAERWFLEFLEKEPDSLDGHLNLFKAYWLLERADEAWDHLQIAVGLDPNHRGALEQMAKFLEGADRRDEALERMREIGESHPDAAAPWMVLAGLHAADEATDEEIACLAEAQRRAPDDPEILLAYTATLGQHGRAAEVEALLGPRKDQLGFELTVNLVLAMRSQGHLIAGRKALEDFRDRVKADPALREKADQLLEHWDEEGSGSGKA